MILGNPCQGTIHPEAWVRPSGNLDLQLTQPFGCTGVTAERPLGTCAHFHRGIDMGNALYGADILAAAAGTVTQAGLNPGGALVVVIDHGQGFFTGYAHLEDKTVAVGAQVTKGQKVGDLGSTGATAPHLHFAAKSGLDTAPYFWGDDHGKWVDPWPLLAQNTGGIMLGPVSNHDPKLADFPAGETQFLEDGKTPDTVKTAGGTKVPSPCAIGPLRGYWVSVSKGVYGLRFAAPSKVYSA